MYIVHINDAKIECNTAEEVLAIVGAGSRESKRLPSGPREDGVKRISNALHRSWQEAEAYATEHGVTKVEARSILARMKRNGQSKSDAA